MTREEFIQMVENFFDFLTSNYGFKKIKKMYAGIATVVYSNGKTAVNLNFEALDVRVYCEIYKIPNVKLKDCNLNGKYPYITLELLADAIGYPAFHITGEAEEPLYDHGRQLREFSEILDFYAQVLQDSRHNILSGDFDSPKQVKVALKESEMQIAYLHKYLADRNFNVP